MSSFFLFFIFILQLCHTHPFFINNKMLSLYRNLKKNVPRSYDPLDNKKLIISTPAGLHGFYLFGVSTYIKKHYNLTNYIYSGASAGSWNSLFLSFRGNDTAFIEKALNPSVYNVSTILQIEKNMKHMILENYNETDFDLDKIHFGVSILAFPLRLKLKIYSGFLTLEDAINACIASSHIPFITGGPIHIYRRRISIDGGIFSYPYLKYIRPEIIINPTMWNSSLTKPGNSSIINFFQIHSTSSNVSELFEAGYNDSKANKEYLDSIFMNY